MEGFFFLSEDLSFMIIHSANEVIHMKYEELFQLKDFQKVTKSVAFRFFRMIKDSYYGRIYNDTKQCGQLGAPLLIAIEK